MSKRLPAKKTHHDPRQSDGLSPAALTLLIAFGAIGGLHGVAEIISAVSEVIEVAAKRCNSDDAGANASRNGGGGR